LTRTCVEEGVCPVEEDKREVPQEEVAVAVALVGDVEDLSVNYFTTLVFWGLVGPLIILEVF
jgi:hypothetical protein